MSTRCWSNKRVALFSSTERNLGQTVVTQVPQYEGDGTCKVSTYKHPYGAQGDEETKLLVMPRTTNKIPFVGRGYSMLVAPRTSRHLSHAVALSQLSLRNSDRKKTGCPKLDLQQTFGRLTLSNLAGNSHAPYQKVVRILSISTISKMESFSGADYSTKGLSHGHSTTEIFEHARQMFPKFLCVAYWHSILIMNGYHYSMNSLVPCIIGFRTK